MKNKNIKRGDIFYADLNPIVGSEQGDTRPVLVVQNDMGNEHSPCVIVTPLTGNLKKIHLPTHVVIPRSVGLDRDSLALVEQIRTIDRTRISDYIGRINDTQQAAIDKALSICVGLEKRRSPKGEMLVLSLCGRCERDFRNSGYLLVKKGWQENLESCDFCKNAKGLTFGVFNMDGGE
jgi:mRNA interferase MazF